VPLHALPGSAAMLTSWILKLLQHMYRCHSHNVGWRYSCSLPWHARILLRLYAVPCFGVPCFGVPCFGTPCCAVLCCVARLLVQKGLMSLDELRRATEALPGWYTPHTHQTLHIPMSVQ